MKSLHPVQKSLLELLKENVEDPLTLRELQEHLELSSPSVVHHHVRQLEKKGYLKRNPNNPKDYQILTEPERPIVYLNLYGMARCGPNGSVLDGDPIDRIPIASRLIRFPSENAFLVEAKGDSMEPSIREGDLVIAEKASSADSNDTVVCVHRGMVLIKKIFQQGGQFILRSENEAKYPPIIAEEEELKVEGVVKGKIQYS